MISVRTRALILSVVIISNKHQMQTALLNYAMMVILMTYSQIVMLYARLQRRLLVETVFLKLLKFVTTVIRIILMHVRMFVLLLFAGMVSHRRARHVTMVIKIILMHVRMFVLLLF